MDEKTKQAATAVLIRCKGQSRLAAEGFLATLIPPEIEALASVAEPIVIDGRTVDYSVRPGSGALVALILDEIADRHTLVDVERRLQDNASDKHLQAEQKRAAGRHEESRQRRAAWQWPAAEPVVPLASDSSPDPLES